MHRLAIALLLVLTSFCWSQVDPRDTLTYSAKSRFGNLWWEVPGNEIVAGPTYDQLSGWLDVVPTLGCLDIEIVQWVGADYERVGAVNMEKSILQKLATMRVQIELSRRAGDSTFRDSTYWIYTNQYIYYANFIGGENQATWYWCKYSE